MVTTSSEQVTATVATSRRIAAVAHRGSSATTPENTLAAVRAAVTEGSDLVEVDVQRTRDGALVLMHDTTLVRTTDVREVFGRRRAPWLVSDFTYDEICALDAGSWKAPEHTGERVPTLQEAVGLLRGTDAGLLVELKAPALYPGIVAEVAAALGAVPGLLAPQTGVRRWVLESFDASAVREFKALQPAATVGLLGRPHESRLPELARWADQVNPNHRAVSARYVDAVHRLGMECLVWTVNSPAAMRRAVNLGVDGIITDRPLALRRDVLGR